MSNSVRLHRRQPTMLLCPWDSPGKNTGVGCYFLLQCMQEKSESEVAQSCLTLSDPMDCSPARLLRPWDFPAKSTGVGCHRLPLVPPIYLLPKSAAPKSPDPSPPFLQACCPLLRCSVSPGSALPSERSVCPGALGSEPWFPLVQPPSLSLAARAPATEPRSVEERDFLLQ